MQSLVFNVIKYFLKLIFCYNSTLFKVKTFGQRIVDDFQDVPRMYRVFLSFIVS